MATNRYSNGTVAKFNPLSFQELSAAPLMQRQKHDQLIVQQEMLRQGLAKTNPHDKYFDEAVRLKNELNNQITSQAELLSKEGVNPNSQADFLKLNRNYQETMSPTGKLGMINAHNVNLQSTYKNYIDEAIKAGQSPAIAKLHADQAIQKHMQQPLYDERGRVVDFSAGNAAPKYIDNVKWINDLATNVGFSKSDWANASSAFSQNAEGKFIVNSNAKGMSKDNVNNLNRLAQLANAQVSDPRSEIRQNIDYNFKDPQVELTSMLNHLYSKRINEVDNQRSQTIDNVKWNENKALDPNNPYGVLDSIFDPSSTREVGVGIKEIDYNKIGTSKPSTTITESGNFQGYNDAPRFKSTIGGVNTYKDIITDPLQQKFYETAAKRLIKKGKIAKDANLNDPKTAGIIGFYMKNHMKVPTVGNDIVRPDVRVSQTGFMGALAGQSPEDRNQTLTQDVRGADGYAPLREMRDARSKQKVLLKEGEKIEYIGFDAPINYNITGYGNSNEQNIMTHRAQVLDSKGNLVRNVTISRTPNEMKAPLFKKAYEANQMYRHAINNLGEWVQPSGKYSGSKELSKYMIKYNDDGTFQMKLKDDNDKEASLPMNASTYFATISSILKDIE